MTARALAWQWRDRFGDVEVVFAGKGLPDDRGEAMRAVVPAGLELAWLQQVHSIHVETVARRGADGKRGEGDALTTTDPGLALSVVTADCVPILATDGERIAAIHAGWKGVAGNIVSAALAPWPAPPRVAWIGPSICGAVYEVGEEVAGPVVAASDASVRHEGQRGRPHLDLGAAALLQLRRLGVAEVRRSPLCTFTEREALWSWRRDGASPAGRGRNLAAIWRR